MEWNQLTIPLASALLGAAIAVGITRQKIERLIQDVDTNTKSIGGLLSVSTVIERINTDLSVTTKSLHSLADKLQNMELRHITELAHLQREMHDVFVTFKQFEAHVNSVKAELSEVKADVKQLLEMMAIMNARHEKKATDA